MRYAKIAKKLQDKTVRDVALRCRWMTVWYYFFFKYFFSFYFLTIEIKVIFHIKQKWFSFWLNKLSYGRYNTWQVCVLSSTELWEPYNACVVLKKIIHLYVLVQMRYIKLLCNRLLSSLCNSHYIYQTLCTSALCRSHGSLHIIDCLLNAPIKIKD